ncbi:RpiB/LacA/LacB family sugar-phosphate isomerase [Candidatus Uhrbacteria bacterium]|nr:RpiB/LacA/LacB family sugar-phosphate isomerase [Candidatus Uhrbacteria bacterium]
MKRQTIYLAADHAGFGLKERLFSALCALPVELVDLTPRFVAGDDYPAIGRTLARKVAKGKDARGILICGSGIGVAIAANRVNGARAFDAHSAAEVKLARRHNDANILALSGWNLDKLAAMNLIRIFLKTPFSRAKRHHRRVRQLQ